ncbi:Nuclear pore complex protein Nup54 [Tyrophagus putrescentiae]|nr:Nuclear pore complex protein Nup54 [Tyrophagus putrescentiae]
MSGFNFGATATSQASQLGFGFGSQPAVQSSSTGFGVPSSTASGGTSSFGGGGGGGSSSLFSFPASNTGTANSSAAGTLFGASSLSNPSSFSLNPTTTTSSSLFSSFQPTSTNTFSGFGSSFGATANKPANTGFAFGPSNTSSLFGTTQTQQQQQLPQQQQQQQQQQQIGSLFAPKIYNDERDNIIGLFNSVQAFWGTGKAFYSAFNPPHQFTDSDQYNRFKTIVYSEIATDDKEGEEKIFFLLRVTTDESQLKTSLLTYENNFKQIVGNNYTVKLELKNILPDSKAIISITVIENATSKAIPEAQLRTFFSQPNSKQQLNSIFAGTFIEVLFLSLSKQELDSYLSMPPKGIDERIWTQAKLENPDPSRFTPLPLIGFNSLNNRFKMQEKEIQQQQMRLKQIIDNVTGLESDIAQFKAKFEDCRRKHASLSYQVLKKMISQEVQRKRTLPIQAEEDKLRANLEAIQSELNVPTKFQGCLNELMSQLRQMQCQSQLVNTITPDKNAFNEYKQFLMEENAGIMSLVDLFKKDIEDINRLTNK